MRVRFLNLKIQYEALKDEIDAALQAVIDSTAFAGGPFVAEFERDFAAFCSCEHAIGVGSGTEALWLTMLALGIRAGDEVITVPNTFIATVEAITFCGASPVFVDVDDKTQTMDPRLLEEAITSRTRAIVPVHLFGQTANMDTILEIADRRGLYVIEDACQAHGARHRDRRAGSMGIAGCFSFYPGKNLGAYGEAGAVVTSDDDLARKLRVLRDHGQQDKHRHTVVGWNARMDGFQAAVLGVKLKYLEQANEARRRNAELYRHYLPADTPLVPPCEDPHNRHVYHIFAVRTPDRDSVRAALQAQGIDTGIHYPVPVHLQPAYADLPYGPGSFPVAERCAGEILSLPMFPELTAGEIEYVCGAMTHAVDARLTAGVA